MTEQTNTTYEDDVKMALAMMDDESFDWDTHWKNDARDLRKVFQSCIVPMVESDSDEEYWECGSWKPSSTPEAFYRLLWLVSPVEPIEFKDMYKKFILAFLSKDRNFLIAVHWYKYELGFYIYAKKNLIDFSKASGIRAGHPGASNGEQFSDDANTKFLEMCKRIFDHTHMVYGGNNFEV